MRESVCENFGRAPLANARGSACGSFDSPAKRNPDRESVCEKSMPHPAVTGRAGLSR